MYKKHSFLLATLLLISSFGASALQLGPINANKYPQANDDHISLVAGEFTVAEGNVGGNDRYGTTHTLNGSWIGIYGLITSFDSEGEYTYQLFDSTTNDSLPSNGVGIDIFSYTLANESGQTDIAQLIIDVHANTNPNQSPIAVDDHESVVIGEKTNAIGNVSTNDLYGNIVSFNQSTGQYGFVTLLDSSGSYIYTLYESTDNASLEPDGVDTDSFTYTYTNSVGLADTAQLIINVSANPSQSRPPIANDDQNSVIITVNPTTSGNVSNNDRYGSIVTFNEPTTGKYGFLSSTKQSGEYTYQLFESTNTDDLPQEGVDTETFTYTLANEDGSTDGAQLIIIVTANPNPTQPVANDDHGSVVIGVKPSVVGNVTTNDLNGIIVSFNESSSGQYGFLTPTDSKGGYIYKLFDSTDGSSLPPSGVGIDNFTYTLANALGETNTAKLIIDVSVTKADQPIAIDDHESVVIAEKPSVAGNVIDNDLYGNLVSFNKSSGKYGFLETQGNSGAYLYKLYSSTSNTNLPPEGFDTETFTYTLANEDGTTDDAQLIISVTANPNPTQPVANDDHGSVVIGVKPSAVGNVTTNDLNGDIVSFNESSSGQYGFLTPTDSKGGYIYKLFDSTNGSSLPPNGIGFDNFTYTLANASGETDTAKLIIDVSVTKTDQPLAIDDHESVVITEKPSVAGNVINNDLYGNTVIFNTTTAKYGFLEIPDNSGAYLYKLYSSTDNTSLPESGVDIDSFNYTLYNEKGTTSTAILNITVKIDPAFAGQPGDQPYDNVDVEFNNRSAQATTLNSGRNIKGHLYDSGDKDWFSLASAGDEIITLEVCPKGTSCFGKKSWVLYVFDPDRLKALNDLNAPHKGEFARFQFLHWVDETGTDKDLLGNTIISPDAGTSNHMYLAYNAGYFEGALIGIVDPCFDTLNTVDIGVPPGPRNYLIAISSPLLGDGNDGGSDDSCGQGSVVLEKPDLSASGLDAEGKEKTYSTTREYITSFPNSDDQYAIKITGTGINPLNSATAKANASIYNSFELLIPRVLAGEQEYKARLTQLHQARNGDSGIQFTLSAIEPLAVTTVDPYRATYSFEDKKVRIPRVTDINTGIGYSVTLQFHEGNNAYFDVISVVEIK